MAMRYTAFPFCLWAPGEEMPRGDALRQSRVMNTILLGWLWWPWEASQSQWWPSRHAGPPPPPAVAQVADLRDLTPHANNHRSQQPGPRVRLCQWPRVWLKEFQQYHNGNVQCLTYGPAKSKLKKHLRYSTGSEFYRYTIFLPKNSNP